MKLIRLLKEGAYLLQGNLLLEDAERFSPKELDGRLAAEGLPPLKLRNDREFGLAEREKNAKGCISEGVIASHNKEGDEKNLRIRFDALTSHRRPDRKSVV